MLCAGAQRGLQAQSALRAFSTGSAANAVPALSETASNSVSWLGKLLGGSSRIDVALTDPLPGVELPPPLAAPSKAPSTETTKLGNGLIIASEATLVCTCSVNRLVYQAFTPAQSKERQYYG